MLSAAATGTSSAIGFRAADFAAGYAHAIDDDDSWPTACFRRAGAIFSAAGQRPAPRMKICTPNARASAARPRHVFTAASAAAGRQPRLLRCGYGGSRYGRKVPAARDGCTELEHFIKSTYLHWLLDYHILSHLFYNGQH